MQVAKRASLGRCGRGRQRRSRRRCGGAQQRRRGSNDLRRSLAAVRIRAQRLLDLAEIARARVALLGAHRIDERLQLARRILSRDDLRDRHAERIDVVRRNGRLARADLWAQVIRRGRNRRRRSERGRDPKVDHAEVAAHVAQHLGGLQVAVHDAERVGRIESGRNLGERGESLARRAAAELGEARTLEVLAAHEGRVVAAVVVEDARDVCVCERPGIAARVAQCLPAVRVRGIENPQRDQLSELRVLGEAELGRASGSDGLQDQKAISEAPAFHHRGASPNALALRAEFTGTPGLNTRVSSEACCLRSRSPSVGWRGTM